MTAIGEDAVARVRATVTGLPAMRRRAEMERLGARQPDLQSFVFDATADLGAPAQELAGYVLFAIHEAFRIRDGHVPGVSTHVVLRRFDENRQLLERLGAEVFAKADAPGEVTAQPALFSYMVEMVFGQNAAEPEIDGDEQGTLFLILKTVIDVLDDAAGGSP